MVLIVTVVIIIDDVQMTMITRRVGPEEAKDEMMMIERLKRAKDNNNNNNNNTHTHTHTHTHTYTHTLTHT